MHLLDDVDSALLISSEVLWESMLIFRLTVRIMSPIKEELTVQSCSIHCERKPCMVQINLTWDLQWLKILITFYMVSVNSIMSKGLNLLYFANVLSIGLCCLKSSNGEQVVLILCFWGCFHLYFQHLYWSYGKRHYKSHMKFS